MGSSFYIHWTFVFDGTLLKGILKQCYLINSLLSNGNAIHSYWISNGKMPVSVKHPADSAFQGQPMARVKGFIVRSSACACEPAVGTHTGNP